MAGRKVNVPLDILKKIFEENVHRIIDDRKKVVVPSNGIWNTIREQIENKKSAKAIYNDALRWWEQKSLETSDQNVDRLNDLADISIETSPPSACNSDESNLSSQDEALQANDINFTISLSYDVWKTIQPVETEHRRQDKTHNTNIRTYYALQPGLWTSVLVDHIAQHRINNPCTWSFKRSKVYPNGKKYIILSAKCTTCGAFLIGEVSEAPKKDNVPVKFKFIVRGFVEEKHANNRKNVRIGGSKANELFSSDKKASVLKRKIIKESGAKMFEPDKGRAISENAIRAGQSRRRQLNKLSLDPIQSLQFLKASNAFQSMIHGLGFDPFFVMYGSPNQFSLYTAYKKHNKYTKITCDATGSIVHKLGKQFFLSKFLKE